MAIIMAPEEVVIQSNLYTNQKSWEQDATLAGNEPHQFFLTPAEDNFSFSVSFSPNDDLKVENFLTTKENNRINWQQFWESGGAIDFSGSTDPRASELERRVILSQYLSKIQSSGNLPPQETGLTYNSWYGNFHLEMHWWHGVHFMLWNRPELFANSMDWYHIILPQAKATAQWQGYAGARWPKMVAPDGAGWGRRPIKRWSILNLAAATSNLLCRIVLPE